MSANPLFCCPIHLGVMTRPVTTPCGHTFDENSMQAFLSANPYTASCPTCRAPLPAGYQPTVNFDLKAIIEQATSAPAPAEAPAPAPAVAEPPPIQLSVKRVAGTNKLHVALNAADDPDATLPTTFYNLLDMSGSMGGRASEPTADQTESSQFTRMDYVIHSVLTQVKLLNEKHRLAVFGFDTETVTYIPPTQMNAAGKSFAESKLPLIRPRGGTSFWAGLQKVLATLEATFRPNENVVIVMQTDGESDRSYDPPRGIADTFRGWVDRHPTIKFTLHTVGYGYGDALQMPLLQELATIGNGTVSYIPDGSMVGTVFIHRIANLMACLYKDVTVSLRAAPGVTLSPTFLKVGFLQGGQSRDFIVDMTGAPTTETLLTATVGEKEFVVPAALEDTTLDSAIARDIFITALSAGIAAGSMDVAAVCAQLSALRPDPYILGLISDLSHPEKHKGQVGKAFAPENFSRWGRHYLPGVLSGHCEEWTVNFRDEGGKWYGGDTVRRYIAQGVDIFDGLPAPKATFAPVPAPAPAAPYHNLLYGAGQGYGQGQRHGAPPPPVQATRLTSSAFNAGCFTGDSLVRMTDGTEKRMDELRKGDFVHGNLRVRCMLKMASSTTPIVRIGNAGWTPTHPIVISGQWVFPHTVSEPVPTSLDAVYNVLLESGHTLTMSDIVTCTLCHELEGPVISHPYFGKREHGKPNIMDDLVADSGWDAGYITWTNVQEIRDATGIVRLTHD